MAHIRPAHPAPPNTANEDRDLGAVWPVNDRNEKDDWTSRLNEAAHLLGMIGRHSSSWRAQCALRYLADYLGSGANPDEAEVILRALVAPVPRDGVAALDPNTLSFRYGPGITVRVTHEPTGIVRTGWGGDTRAANTAHAASKLAQAVDRFERAGEAP